MSLQDHYVTYFRQICSNQYSKQHTNKTLKFTQSNLIEKYIFLAMDNSTVTRGETPANHRNSTNSNNQHRYKSLRGDILGDILYRRRPYKEESIPVDYGDPECFICYKLHRGYPRVESGTLVRDNNNLTEDSHPLLIDSDPLLDDSHPSLGGSDSRIAADSFSANSESSFPLYGLLSCCSHSFCLDCITHWLTQFPPDRRWVHGLERILIFLEQPFQWSKFSVHFHIKMAYNVHIDILQNFSYF